ncbi:MAG TPA: hypothetical protein DEF45_07130 [Rhodopirellula sp.]|nr:hypothetical protein [Rhodopirellula sp.]
MTVLSSGLPPLLDQTFKVFSRFILISTNAMAAIRQLWFETLPKRESLNAFLTPCATRQPSGSFN